MKRLPLLLLLSFFSIQSFAGSCPDGSEPIKSISADGTYFVYNCGEQSSSELDSIAVKTSDINFPGKFYTSEISACKALVPISFSSNSSINFVKGLVGYDWHSDWEANSNSMNVYHEKITEPMNMLMAATHNALGKDNQANINTAKSLLIELAKTDTLYDSIGYIEVKKKPGCYAGGDINAPCWYHQYQFASNVFSNYMITALWLRDELNEQEFKIVDKYIKKMYKKFLQPIELQEEEQGFYAMANGGTSILAYASWTNDKELAAEEIDHRFKEMDRLFYDDGYINNNSFRGYRGQWYHSYGLDIALGYVYIAELWGAEIPEKLQNKLVKAAEVANLAITDWDKFKSRKYSGENHNAIDDPNNAIKHTHQYAIAIDTLMKIVTGVELEFDPMYLQKRRHQIKKSYGIDELIGFPPNCTLEALKTETEQAINSSKTTQNKSIFVSNQHFNDFLNLPREDRINSCGYKSFSPNWQVINKDLAPRIKGYNSKMDNWRNVEGAYSRDVLVKYLESSTFAMVSDDEALKEKLFDKLYQWASKDALSATMQCYSNGPQGVLPACEGEWSDPNGQDLAPIKDATVAVETVMSLNYLYKLYYADYKPEDNRHKVILGWFESFYPRIKTSRDFYFGNSVGWHFPNISIKHSLDRNYKTLIENMVNGLDEWSFADGSMKERTTRGNRALWYHSNALGEAFIILEIARIADVKIPPNLEKKLLKAAELFNDAFLDHSVIEPWAKKRVRSQASNGRQEFNSNLDSISFYSSWMQIFQLRYPEHRTAKWLNQELTNRAQSLKSNVVTGVPIGCISKALADSSLEMQIKKEGEELKTSETPKVTTSDSDPTVSKVIEVIQGDKFIVDIAEPHELAGTNINLNLRDVDAPDAVRSCPKQLELGIKVRDIVAQKLADASNIKLKNFRKTSKAVIADVIIDGKDLGAELIGKGYASDEYGYWKAYFCSALQAINAGVAYNRTGKYEKAIFWLERALVLDPDGSNNSRAKYDLSKIYETYGEYDKSIDYLKQSANLGYMQAEEDLGAAYMNGNGVKKDTSEAKYWLKKAHEHGSKIAEDICGCEF